jgi:hypothetical protein
MGVIIDNAVFTYGASPTTFYQSNAGDQVTATIRIRGQLRVSSLNNTLTLDPSTNQITSPGVSWLDEGFRPGDWLLVYIRLYPSGSATTSFWTQVQAVTDQVLDVTSVPSWYDFTSEYIEFYVVQGNGSFQQVEREEVDVLLNHSINSQPGTANSLIDGEVTRIRFSNLPGSGVGTPINGTILGNQSGQFLLGATLTQVTIPDTNFYGYDLEITFVNSGLYDTDGSWFFSGEALKAFISTQWARVSGEPYARLESNYDQPGDTGYFNEAYNIGIADSTLIQGTSEIDYCTPTTHTVIVDGPTADVMIGAAYLPTDFAYYKNKVQSQTALTMIIPSTPIAIGTLSSYLNPSGAGYDLDITGITVSGSQTQIDFTFIPNAALETFMDTREPEDRQFLVWVKCGSINHLVYNSLLECTPPPADPLIMEKSAAFLDHAKNVSTWPTDLIDRECNTEDDLAYYGEFLLTKGSLYDRFTVYMEASNSVTGDDFSLKVLEFNFSGVPYSGDGRYLLNELQSVNAALPTTSQKRDAILKLEPTLDTVTEYGVSIYSPYLMDWRYWIPFPAASTDFWPTQNKNWVQYEASPWNVQLRLELVDDLGGHNHIEDVKIFDYDSNPIVNQTIELYEDSSNLNVPIILEGQLHRVVTLHTLTGGLVWDPSNIWGQITVEPFEGQPRWICSTAVDYDNNTNNPLTPLSGSLINITYPAANIARLECYFNPDLLNLSNGVKFTTKIKGCTGDPEIGKTTAPDDIQKTTTDGSNKTLAI